MADIPNIADIIAAYASQDKALRQSAADLGAMILEMQRDEEYCGIHARRLAELKKLATLQEQVVQRMLSKSIAEDECPKKPHLTVVK